MSTRTTGSTSRTSRTSRTSTSRSTTKTVDTSTLSPAQRRVFSVLRRGSWTHPSSITRVGGQEGLRRLRELRAAGFNIQKQYFQKEGVFKYKMTF